MRLRTLLFLLIFAALPARAQTTDPLVTAAQVDVIGIDYGLRITGTLGNAAPRAIYAFDGMRGEVVSVTLTTKTGDLDPMLTVLDADGVPLAHFDDMGSSRDLRLESLRLPRSDRYLLVVARFGYALGTTSGTYDLTIERVGVSSASGSALRYGDTIINEISDVTPQIYYSFRARRGDIVNIQMQRISGNLDTYLQVVNQNALVVADNDDMPGSGSLDAEISNLVVEEDGTYVIIASRFGQAAGRSAGGFSLILEEAVNSGMGNSLAAALPVLEDLPMEGELSNEHYARFYQFDAQANEVVSVRMERLNGSIDSFLAIATDTGVELTANDDVEGSQNSAIENFLIPADGTYTIIATRFEREVGQTAGRYRLSFERKGNALENVPTDMQFIPYGSTITGSIDDATPQRLYAFFGQQGDVITAAMTRGDGDLDPVVSVLDAAQRELTGNDDADGSQNARIDRFALPATGVYYLRAARFSGEGRPPTHGSFILVLAQRFD